MKNSCKDCCFFDSNYCCRYPPQFYLTRYENYTNDTESRFPEVGEDEWCGEFVERESNANT